MDSVIRDNSSMSICAACGSAGDNLKACTSCKQVKYCNRNCQKLHWPKHKKECKQLAARLRAGDNKSSDKSIAEGVGSINISGSATTAGDKKTTKLHEQKTVHVKNHHVAEHTSSNNSNAGVFRCSVDLLADELFQDPPPKDECPICMLPMPHSIAMCGRGMNAMYMSCCGKHLCYGCMKAEEAEMNNGNIKFLCSFCRLPIPLPDDHNEHIESLAKRIKLNDAKAYFKLGLYYENEGSGVPQDMNRAFELLNQAAELGDVNAQYHIATQYMNGSGRVSVDMNKAVHYFKLAAIGGHEGARHCMGLLEDKYNKDRAMKHFVIAAKSGLEEALRKVGEGYKTGHVSKDEYASTLRTYQSIRNDMKSEQRTKAEQEKL